MILIFVLIHNVLFSDQIFPLTNFSRTGFCDKHQTFSNFYIVDSDLSTTYTWDTTNSCSNYARGS